MIIDLILDRKDFEESDEISVATYKFSELWTPLAELYAPEDIPEQFRGCFTYHYNARGFYHRVMGYGAIGDAITAAMDYGTEEDVKRALCDYIDRNDYNPDIKNYINSVAWLTDAA